MKTNRNNTGNKYSLIIFGIIGLLVIFNACKKTANLQIASEKIILSSIAIKTTDTLPVLIGTDTLLKFITLPLEASNGSLIWSSSNTSVATVDEKGRVKAIASGEAKITASSTDGGGRTSTILVRAISSINLVTDIALTVSATSIYEGESLVLKTKISPANATYATLKWDSSNPAVATVSDAGVVKAIAKGSVDITVSSTDGSKVVKKVSLVINEVIAATALSIPALIEPMGVGETLALTVSTVPANATAAALTWSSSSPAFVTVSQTGNVTAIAAGESTITVKNSSGVQATVKVTVDEGKINDVFTGATTPWFVVSNSSFSGISYRTSGGIFYATMGSNSSAVYRGDFQRTGGITVSAGKYPIIAFKFTRPAAATPGNLIFDTNLGTYLNGNNKLTTITGKDGVDVQYANLATGSFGSGPTVLSLTAPTTFSTFQLKFADVKFSADQLLAGNNTYKVYWVKTFKSLTDLQAYIAK